MVVENLNEELFQPRVCQYQVILKERCPGQKYIRLGPFNNIKKEGTAKNKEVVLCYIRRNGRRK